MWNLNSKFKHIKKRKQTKCNKICISYLFHFPTPTPLLNMFLFPYSPHTLSYSSIVKQLISIVFNIFQKWNNKFEHKQGLCVCVCRSYGDSCKWMCHRISKETLAFQSYSLFHQQTS